MNAKQLKNHLLILSILIPFFAWTQQNPGDCLGATVICGDSAIDVIDDNGDVIDFNNPDNPLSCHLTGERSSTWLYFSFDDNMPPNQMLEFVISPYESDDEVDYDFSLYANVDCDSLGEPLRCSYSNGALILNCGFCPDTGLGMGEIDTTEGPFGNGFLAPIVVNPGDGFYLWVNEFYDPLTGSISNGFDLSFSGPAADYFDCGANPNCDLVTVNAGNDTTICNSSTNAILMGSTTYTTGFETITWTGTNGEEAFLDNPSNISPTLSIPDDYTGSIRYILEIAGSDCTYIDSIDVNIVAPPSYNLPDTAFCAGDTLVLQIDSAFDTYLWSTGSNADSTIISTPDAYTVTLTSSAGICTIIDTVHVNEIAPPVPDINGSSQLCVGDTITLDGGTGFNSYSWNGIAGGQFLPITAPGIYTLEVSNSIGCTGLDSIEVTSASLPSVSISGPVGLCPDEIGTLDAGPGYASYIWSNDSTTQSITIDSAGTYSVTVTNAQGCRDFASITIQAFNTPQPLIIGDTILCFGESTPLVADLPYTSYLWSTSEITPAILIDTSGTFTLLVTNDEGCIGSDSITVILNDSLVLDINIAQNANLCTGDTITLNATTGFDSYLWSDSSMLDSLLVDEGGNYSVTASDTFGCSVTSDILISELSLPDPNLFGPTGFCPGDSITLQVDFFEEILWSDGSMDTLLQITLPGPYSVTVTDEFGCTNVQSTNIQAFTNPHPEIIGDSIVCFGDAIPLLADMPYDSYQWSTGALTPAILFDTTGTVTLSVTNTDGCIGSDTLLISLNDSIELTLEIAQGQSLCAGDSITLVATSDIDNYLWNNSMTTNSIVVFNEGTYIVTVTDTVGCTATADIFVPEIPLPIPNLTGPATLCSNDTITLEVDTFNEIQWNDSSTDSILIVTTPGNYSVTVTNASGCVSSDSITIIETTPPNPTIAGVDSLCEGTNTVLTVTQPFQTYEWSTGINFPAILVGSAGIYELTVTDANGCSGQTQIEIFGLDAPDITMDTLQFICENDSVSLSPTGIFTEYNWSTGSMDSTITVSQSGLYSVTVTGQNECTNNIVVEVNVNPLPNPPLNGNTYYCFNDSTTLEILDSSIISFNWSNGSMINTAVFNAVGMYSLEVVDSNNCQNTITFDITEEAEIDLSVTGDTLLCEGQTAAFQSDGIFQAYEWSNGDSTSTSTATQNGTYYLTVTNNLGCQAIDSINLTLQMPPDPILQDTFFLCEDGIDSLLAIGGFASYLWSNGDTTAFTEIDQPGTYSILVSDDLGCTNTDTIEVANLVVSAPMISGDLSICPGDTNQLVVEPIYTGYMWSTGDTTSNIPITEAGFYQVSVTNTIGCQATSNIFVVSADSVLIEVIGENNFCQGDSATLSIIGNGNYIIFEWSDGDMTDQNVVTETGTYSVTVTSIQGCTATDSAEILVFDNPEVGLVDSIAICETDSVLLEGPPGFTSYEWQDGSLSSDITISQSGLYVLSVVDTNGCAIQDSTLAFVQSNPSPEIMGENSFCPGDNISLTLNNSWANQIWSTGEDTSMILIETPGMYYVTVSDEFGCTGIDSILVDTFSIAVPDITGPPGLCPGDTAFLEVPSIYQTYEWSNNTFDTSILVSTPGMYMVTIVDNNDCEAETSFELLAFDQPEVTIIGQDSICEGSTTLLAADDLSFQFYEWSNSMQTTSIQTGDEGLYILNITDNNGCVASDSLFVTSISAPAPQIQGDSLICEGTSTVLTINEVYPAYDWGNGNTSQTLTVDTAGTYSVTVSNTFGCKNIANFDLDIAPLPAPQITGDSTFCDGSVLTLEATILYDSLWWSTGDVGTSIAVDTAGLYSLIAQDANGCIDSISLSVQELALPTLTFLVPATICDGDTAQLSVQTDGTDIEWSTGANTPSIDVFEADIYSVNITSALGCVSSDSIDVSINSLPSPQIVGDSLICEGTSTELSLTEAYPNYDWGNNNNDATLTANLQGNYSVTVTDEFGCSGSTTFDLSIAALPTPQITGSTGLCDGDSLILEASILYDSLWWNTGMVGTSIIIDTAGLYSLFAQDANGCIDSTNITVQAQALPTLTLDVPDVLCEGDTVQLTVQTNGADILWSTGASTATIDVFEADLYYVDVTGTNGCMSSDSTAIITNSLPNPNILGDSLICDGSSTELSIDGVYASYDWGNGNNEATLTINAEGLYGVTVSDDFGCLGSAIFNLTLAPLPTPQITGETELCDGDSLLLEAAIIYDSLWWNTGIVGSSILVETAGPYTLTAQDTNGCIDSISVVVDAEALPTLTFVGPTAICIGDTAQLSVETNGSIIIWSTGEDDFTIDVFEANTYGVEITGANGCIQTDSITLIVNELPTYNAGEDQVINCIIDEVTIGTPGGGSTPNLEYQWNGPGIIPDSIGIPQPTVSIGGIYTVTTTDTLTGCMSIPDTVLVNDVSYEPIAIVQVNDTLDCNSPSITLEGTGSSTGPGVIYQWQWPNNEITTTTTPVLVTDLTGNYVLTVLDTITGCNENISAMVSANFEYPVLSIAPPLDLNCIRDTVSLMANASTPSGMISTQWLSENQQPISGANQLILDVQAPGWYYLLITESISGCQSLDSIEVLENIVFPIADAGDNQEIDCISMSATLDGTASSQGAIYQYVWTSPNGTEIEGTLQPTIDISGTYMLAVINLENGCESNDDVLVNVDEAFLLNADANIIPPLCEGDANGQVFINNIIGGTPPFLYSLDDGPFTDQPSISGLSEGSYTLTVEDLEGCTIEVPFYMEDGTIVQVELGDNVEISLGDQLNLNAQTNLLPSEIGQVIWSPLDSFTCNDCLIYTSFPLQSSLYTATVIDTNGCVGTDMVQVFLNKERSVYIPNGFSPNADGSNDTFLIYAGDDVVRINSFAIYNRWGGLLFEANDFLPNDPAHGWNGTYMGEELDPAVFVYAAEIEFVDGRIEVFKGDVVLVK